MKTKVVVLTVTFLITIIALLSFTSTGFGLSQINSLAFFIVGMIIGVMGTPGKQPRMLRGLAGGALGMLLHQGLMLSALGKFIW